MVLTTFLAVLGKALQSIPFDDSTRRAIFITLGQFLCMATGILALGVPPLVSSAWFPPSKRTTATAIGSLVGYCGIAVAFCNGTCYGTWCGCANQFQQCVKESTQDPAKLIDQQLRQYAYFELALCTAVVLCAFVHFPARPPFPQSLASSTPHRVSTKASLKMVRKNGQFL